MKMKPLWLRNAVSASVLSLLVTFSPLGGFFVRSVQAETEVVEAVASPVLATEKADYQPGETVTLFGSLFQSLQNIVVTFFGDSEVGDHYYESTIDLVTDVTGGFTLNHVLDTIYRPLYTVVARNLEGETLATTTFTDAPSAAGNLDQCANGTLAAPATCAGSAWQNGNLNANQAHYVEGDSAPYRMVLTNVPTSGVNTVVIEYDVKHSGKHAVDFLTSFDRTETTANPCSGVATCVGPILAAIPAPSATASPVVGMPTSAFNLLPAGERNFSLYNAALAGTGITYVTEGDLNAAQSATSVKIQFTASNSTVVLAWGGHIGASLDWGAGNAAGGISGSPYHMRFIELNGKGGNQDRSMSSGAIVPVIVEELGSVTIDKVTLPAGDAQSFDFVLAGPVPGAASLADADAPVVLGDLTAGSYTLTEAALAGWTLSDIVCVGGTVSQVAGGVSFDLAAGQDISCTFENTKDAKLTVVKQVVNDNNGPLVAGEFSLLIDGSPATHNVAQVVSVGAHTVSEVAVDGYTQISIGGDCAADGTVSLLPGDNKTCVITNNDIPSEIRGLKFDDQNANGVRDQGEPGIAGWEIALAGEISSTTTTDVNGEYSFTGLSAGDYTVCEANVAGWAQTFPATGFACANDTVGYEVLLENDEVATDISFGNVLLGTVTIDKQTLPEGDTQVFDFALEGPVDGDASLADADAPVVIGGLEAGSYTLTEAALAGWTLSNVVCLGGDVADVQGGVSFDLALGQDISCTFINVKDAKLTVVKEVINDNNGPLDAEEFSLLVDGSPVTHNVAQVVTVGTHTVSEVSVEGYTQVFIGGDCAADGTVKLSPGDEKTCVITNNDIPSEIRGLKFDDQNSNGVHDQGEPGIEGWEISLAGEMLSTTTTDENGEYVFSGLSAGNYTVCEANVAGWAQTFPAVGFACANGTVGYEVSLENDEEVTDITFGNTLLGSVTIDKVTLPEGDVQSFDFALAGPVAGAVSLADATAPVVIGDLEAGSYTLTEAALAGWTLSDISCVGGTVSEVEGGVSFDLALGQDISCTFENTKDAKLIVVKQVVNDNGGLLAAGEFSLLVDGLPATHNVAQVMTVGAHTVSEVAVDGYTQVSIGGDCAADGTVSLLPGDEKTCVIINDDQPSEIHGQKFEDENGNGVKDEGEIGLADWTIVLSGDADAVVLTDVDGNYAFTNLSAGNYTVAEMQQPGFVQTSPAPEAITLGLGEIVEDVDFGNFALVTLSGYKWHDLDADGEVTAGEERLAGWTFFVDTNGNAALDIDEVSAVSDANGNFTLSNVGPGEVSVCEVGQDGWSQTFPLNGECYTMSTASGNNVSDLKFGNMNEHEGTIGFWRNWNRHNKFTETQINGWLSTISTSSAWLMTEAGYSATTTGMVNLINDATKYCSKYPDKVDCAKRKFLAQYMVNRLNIASGKKSLTTTYNLSSFGSAMSYLGISPTNSVSFATYIAKVEAKAATSPNRNQFLWMASVSDFINNIGL